LDAPRKLITQELIIPLHAGARCETLHVDGLSALGLAMSKPDAGYDYDRYRQLLAEADDDSKRMAFINLLIEEKARDKLAVQAMRARLSGLGLKTSSRTDEQG
jgi:hypothetical protein